MNETQNQSDMMSGGLKDEFRKGKGKTFFSCYQDFPHVQILKFEFPRFN